MASPGPFWDSFDSGALCPYPVSPHERRLTSQALPPYSPFYFQSFPSLLPRSPQTSELCVSLPCSTATQISRLATLFPVKAELSICRRLSAQAQRPGNKLLSFFDPNRAFYGLAAQTTQSRSIVQRPTKRLRSSSYSREKPCYDPRGDLSPSPRPRDLAWLFGGGACYQTTRLSYQSTRLPRLPRRPDGPSNGSDSHARLITAWLWVRLTGHHRWL